MTFPYLTIMAPLNKIQFAFLIKEAFLEKKIFGILQFKKKVGNLDKFLFTRGNLVKPSLEKIIYEFFDNFKMSKIKYVTM